MIKWADYLISHTRKNSNEVITHILLHQDNGDFMSLIGVRTLADVINVLKSGKIVKTILWE